MEVKRLRTMALEIFKTLNDLNPPFMKNLINKRGNTNKRMNDLLIPTRNSVMFGDNSFRCLGPHIWNTLPEHVKAEVSFEKIKEYLSTWFGPSCKCNICSFEK